MLQLLVVAPCTRGSLWVFDPFGSQLGVLIWSIRVSVDLRPCFFPTHAEMPASKLDIQQLSLSTLENAFCIVCHWCHTPCQESSGTSQAFAVESSNMPARTEAMKFNHGNLKRKHKETKSTRERALSWCRSCSRRDGMSPVSTWKSNNHATEPNSLRSTPKCLECI